MCRRPTLPWNALFPSLPTLSRAARVAPYHTLSTDIDNDGFYNASAGQGPDRVNALALCRGDVQLNACRECVRKAGSDLVESCPVQKEGIRWDEFCTLRYSNATVHGTLATGPTVYLRNRLNVTSPEQFKADLRALLETSCCRLVYEEGGGWECDWTRFSNDFRVGSVQPRFDIGGLY